MKEFKLPITRIRQTPHACGPASLLQILKYYGFNDSLSNVISNLKITEEEFNSHGAFEGTLSLFALDNNFDVDIISYDTKRFDPTWDFNNREELLKKLKSRLNFLENASINDIKEDYSSQYIADATKYLVDFLENNSAKIRFVPISIKLIEDYIIDKTPIMALVNSCLFFNVTRKFKGVKDNIKGKHRGHWIVISGFDKDNFWITDPANENSESGVYKLDKNKVLNDIIQYGPVLILVRPKKI